MVDSAHKSALLKCSQLGCIDTIGTPSKVNLSDILRSKQYQPVNASFTQKQKDYYINLNSWLDFNPYANPYYIMVPACR